MKNFLFSLLACLLLFVVGLSHSATAQNAAPPTVTSVSALHAPDSTLAPLKWYDGMERREVLQIAKRMTMTHQLSREGFVAILVVEHRYRTQMRTAQSPSQQRSLSIQHQREVRQVLVKYCATGTKPLSVYRRHPQHQRLG